MPIWLVSLLVTILKQSGAINLFEGWAIKVGYSGLQDLKKVKKYSEPPDFPVQKDNFFSDPQLPPV